MLEKGPKILESRIQGEQNEAVGILITNLLDGLV